MFFNNSDKIKFEAISQEFAIVTFKNDGVVTKANRLFLELMGYELSEILGKHHSIFCEKKFTQTNEYKKAWEDLNKGINITSEFKRVKKDGTFVFLRASFIPIKDKNNKVVEVIKLAQDITQKRLQELYFRGQVKAINKSQAVIEFDMQGNILTANDNFLKTLGYKLEDIKGKHHSMFCIESYKNSNAYKEFWQKLNKGEFDSGEYLRVGNNNEKIWIQATYNPIFDINGNPFKVIKYATNITEKKNSMLEIGKKIEDFSQSLKDLQYASNKMVDEAKISMQSTNDVTSYIEDLTNATKELSKKIDFMLSSITNIANTTIQSEKIVQEARNQSKDTAQAMVKLNEESTKIGETINIISQIAFQTNILSLNAAVEAATAGEAGRGFAVVAGEVRNLATRSNDAAKDITEAIELIQSLVKNSLDNINQVDTKIEEINKISSTISSSINEQKNISNDLALTATQTSQTLELVTNNMSKVSNSASSTEQESKKTQQTSNDLIDISNSLIDTLKVLN